MEYFKKKAVQKMKHIQRVIVGTLVVALLAGQMGTLNVSASANMETPGGG